MTGAAPTIPTADAQAGPPLLIDARELARLLSVSTATVWRADAAGRIPRPLRIGGATRWRYAELVEWCRAGCPERPQWEATQSENE